MLVSTLVVSRLVQSPLAIVENRDDALATATYVANVRYASLETAYLTANHTSPMLHYWSLAVEEQFYVAWPALLLGTWWIGRRTPFGPTRAVWALLAVASAISLAISIRWTQTAQPNAYFLLPARAWELGVGALAAMTVPHIRRCPQGLATAVGWLGMAMVGLAVLRFDDRTLFPGTAALLPVAGTVLALASGSLRRGGALHRLLAVRPLQATGRLSYSLYLWHWPLLFLATERFGRGPTWWRVFLLGASFALAAVTYRFVENPIRRSTWLARRRGRNVMLLSGVTATSLLAVVVLTRTPALATTDIAPSAAEVPLEVLAADPADSVPANLRPRLIDAVNDEPRTEIPGLDECSTPNDDTTTVGRCSYGDLESSVSIVLFGDSHANHWIAGMRAAAAAEGWKLIPVTKAGCPSATITVFRANFNRPYEACDTWRRNALDYIRELEPTVVVLASSSSIRAGTADEEWLDGLTATIAALPDASHPVVMADSPRFSEHVPDCLSDHLTSVRACTTERAPAAAAQLRAAEEALVSGAGGSFLDGYEISCLADPCPVIVGDVLAFRDEHHLTVVYSTLLGPRLADRLTPIVAAAGRP